LLDKSLINIDKFVLLGIAFAAIGVAISYADIYLFHIWFLLLGFLSLIKFKNSQYLLEIDKKFSNHLLFLISMFIWYTISLIWTQDIILGIKYLFYIFCGLIISFTIINYSKNLERLNEIYKVLSFVFIIEIIIALLESFSFFRWPISPYSSWHTFFGKETVDYLSYNNILSNSIFSSPTGFHWNTNNLAITMVMILPFFLCHKKLSINLIGSICITLITVFASSRAVFLGLILIFCIYLIVIKKKIRALTFIWLIIPGIFFGMNYLKDSDNPRINEVANSLQALEFYLKGDLDIGGSLEWRRELINDGIDALIKSKGLGLGAGGTTALQEKVGGVAGRFTSMHNFWVEILVEGGIFFGIIGFIWYINILFNLFKILNSKINKQLIFLAQALFLSMIGFIPAAVSASSTIYFFPMWIMFGMAIALILINKNNQMDQINY